MPHKVFTHISTKWFINDSFSPSRAFSPPHPPPSIPAPEGGRGRELISNFARPVFPRIKTHWSTLTVMLARKCSFPEFTPLYSWRRVVYDIYDRVPRNFPRILPCMRREGNAERNRTLYVAPVFSPLRRNRKRTIGTIIGFSRFGARASLRVKQPEKK